MSARLLELSSILRRPWTARSLVRVAILALAIFHVYLLWERLTVGALFRTDVALRWLASAAFASAALWLRGRGVSLSRGRGAAVFWIAVLLLHAGATAPAVTAAGDLLQTLPLGTFGFLALPAIGLHALAERLGELLRLPVGQAPRLAPVRATRPIDRRSLLPRAFPPAHRRPPPF